MFGILTLRAICVLSIAVFGLSACGSSGGSSARLTSPAPAPAIATPSGPIVDSSSTAVVPTTAVSTATPPTMRTGTFAISGQDGTRVTGSLRLTPPMHPADQSTTTAWQALSSESMPCQVSDDSRDAVVLGALSLTNATPSFTPAVKMVFAGLMSADFATSESVGAAFSSGGECTGNGDPLTVVPSFSGTDWGPVGIEIVVPNYYSPAHPQGDPSRLTHVGLSTVVADGQGTYTVMNPGGILAEPTEFGLQGEIVIPAS